MNARIEYAKFLQETVKEMAKEVKNSRSGELKNTAEDLDEFMNKVKYLFVTSLLGFSFICIFLQLANLGLLNSKALISALPPSFPV